MTKILDTLAALVAWLTLGGSVILICWVVIAAWKENPAEGGMLLAVIVIICSFVRIASRQKY